jgi:hypothetical protein
MTIDDDGKAEPLCPIEEKATLSFDTTLNMFTLKTVAGRLRFGRSTGDGIPSENLLFPRLAQRPERQ